MDCLMDSEAYRTAGHSGSFEDMIDRRDPCPMCPETNIMRTSQDNLMVENPTSHAGGRYCWVSARARTIRFRQQSRGIAQNSVLTGTYTSNEAGRKWRSNFSYYFHTATVCRTCILLSPFLSVHATIHYWAHAFVRNGTREKQHPDFLVTIHWTRGAL